MRIPACDVRCPALSRSDGNGQTDAAGERAFAYFVARSPPCYNYPMKRHTTTIALSAILIPSVCFAWGRDGHRITGFIAAKYLTPQAAAAVKDLLGNE